MKFLNKSTFFQPTFFLRCLNLSIFYEKKSYLRNLWTKDYFQNYKNYKITLKILWIFKSFYFLLTVQEYTTLSSPFFLR